jgi:microcin C transport system permease protein
MSAPPPSAPDSAHWLGTDDTSRDVLARVIYGFRLSILFTLIVTVRGLDHRDRGGAIQGYFGGRTDLILQRLLEIWQLDPLALRHHHPVRDLGRSFWLLVFVSILFGWPALVGVVRAEFLRARNFEYVRAARALGVSDRK